MSCHPLPDVRPVAIAAMLLVWCAVPGPAVADVSSEEMEQFESLLQAGSAHLDDENWEAAIEKLDRARQIRDHPQISLNIADAYLQMDRCSDAESEFDALREREDLDEEMNAELQEGLDRLENCVETTPLEIDCDPEETRIHLEGPDLERDVQCPYRGELPVGDYEIRAEADDHQPRSRQTTLAPGRTTTLDLALAPEAPAPDETARDSDTADGETETARDSDTADGETESAGDRDDPGDDEASETTALTDPAPPKSPAPDPIWPIAVSWGALTVGTGFLISGGILDYGAGSRAAELAEARANGDAERLERLENRAIRRRTTAAALYGAGTIFVLGGVALQVLDLPPTSTESGLDLRVAPGGLSAVLQW